LRTEPIRPPAESEPSPPAASAPAARLSDGALGAMLRQLECQDHDQARRRPDCAGLTAQLQGPEWAQVDRFAIHREFGGDCGPHGMMCLEEQVATLSGARPANPPHSGGPERRRIAAPNPYHVDPGFGD
jgi:hypothetical protein